MGVNFEIIKDIKKSMLEILSKENLTSVLHEVTYSPAKKTKLKQQVDKLKKEQYDYVSTTLWSVSSNNYNEFSHNYEEWRKNERSKSTIGIWLNTAISMCFFVFAPVGTHLMTAGDEELLKMDEKLEKEYKMSPTGHRVQGFFMFLWGAGGTVLLGSNVIRHICKHNKLKPITPYYKQKVRL